MKKKEELLEEINRRKVNRKVEISKIPLTTIRKRYMSLADNDEKLKRYFGDLAGGMTKYFNNPVLRPVLHHLWRLTMPLVFKKQFGLGHERGVFLTRSLTITCTPPHTVPGRWKLRKSPRIE